MDKSKEIKKEVTYYQAEKLSLKDLKKTIPKEFALTATVIELFAGIIILIFLLSIFQIPFGSLLSSDKSEVGIGIPFVFMSFDLKGSKGASILYKGMILDLLIYFIIAYVIKVAGCIFLKKFEKKKKRTPPPELYKVSK